MNKLYVTALAIAMASYGASAQSGTHLVAKQRLVQVATPQIHPSAPTNSADRDVIWSNDFSDASAWSIGNVNDPNNDNWVIGTTGPSGSFAIAPIASTTAANGFALFDSDLLCGGSQNAWLAVAEPIDLSGNTGVVLQFEQFYREYQGMCYVETSTDGTNWTTTQINNIGGNNATLNPQLLSMNLSDQVGGAAAAWIRFRYEGGCDYAWMIDDVALVTLPEHEIVMDYGYTSQTGTGYEYGRIPANQLLPDLNVGAEVVNFGGQDQTNVAVNCSLLDPSSNEIGTATTAIDLMHNEDTTVTSENIALTLPLATGIYTANFEVTSDQIGSDDNTSNNSAVRTFEVTSDLYALDGIGVYPDDQLVLSQVGTASFEDNAVNVSFLSYYQVNAPATYYGASILLGSLSEAGSLISIALYDTSSIQLGGSLSNELALSEDHVVTADEITAGQVNLAFLDPISLPAGGYYLSAKCSQQDGNDLYIIDDQTVPQPANGGRIYLPVDAPNNQFFYSNGNAWAIRLSANSGVSVRENEGLAGVSMYPNPTTGVLHINTAKAEPTTVEVRNMLGAIVKTATFNSTVNTLDLTGNAAGLYSVRISNGTNFSVERITLQ